MSLAEKWRFCRDCVWASLDPSTDGARFERVIPEGLDIETVKALHEELSRELSDAIERKKAIDGKLSSIVSMAPIPVTILLAVMTFLTSGRVQTFTGPSIVILSLLAFIIALQFLRALVTAIQGISRMSYWHTRVVLPTAGEPYRAYSEDSCASLLKGIESYEANTDEKVSQLALAHRSLKNAVGWLMLAILVVGIVTASEAFRG